jgi:hypothetical protein
MPKKEKANKPKKRKILTIDVTDLFPDMKLPKNMEIWDKEHPMSKKCQKTIDEMATLAGYIAKQLNTTSDFKNNIAKRAVVLKCLTSVLIQNTFLDNLHRYGVLHECMNEIHRRQHQPVMMLIPKPQATKAQTKVSDRNKDVYVS